jgi:hypothetical protein
MISSVGKRCLGKDGVKEPLSGSQRRMKNEKELNS